MYIAIAILMFGILIAVHELGHFAAAKSLGVRVLEFSIGMGPALLKKQGKETLYTWRLFPIGGFCSMEGEDEDSPDPRAFTNQKLWKRLVILVAGAAMNFIFGVLMILVVFSQQKSFTTPEITGFMEGCPYESANALMEGDIFYKINGERIYFSSNVSEFMARSGGQPVDLVMIRDGKKITLSDFPMTPTEYTINGEIVTRYGLYLEAQESGFFAFFKYSWYCAMDYVRLVRLSLAELFAGRVGVKDLSGPVGIVGLINDVGQSAATAGAAIINIANFSAFIAINLAVMNLLPIPALDGGRILFMYVTWGVEKLTKRKLNPKYEGYVHAAFLLLLLGLSAFVMYNDIVRIISA